MIELQGAVVRRDHCEILVLVSGTVVYTGDNFLSVKRYIASNDLLEGQPQWIDADADPESDPRTWNGWDNFEGNAEFYLFVYGSLVSEKSLKRTIPGGLGEGAGPTPAVLQDWHLAWNVGSEVHSQPERLWTCADGSPFGGIIASLGLLHSQGTQARGAVYRIPVNTLGAFDERERDYDRIEVTGYVSWENMNPEATVHTFVPTAQSQEVMRRGIEEGRAVASEDYVNLIREAFVELNGSHGLPTHQIPTPPCAVQPLTFTNRNLRSLHQEVTDEDLAIERRRQVGSQDSKALEK
jgi:gamma-glutamylcyclotransferase (GGCT)/AIG2-like uncharacterized protein YtfP